ncbi:GNAT family N-acetyltransferase [Aquimarina brevivitae]|uniref:Putative acetyltransferase n=1 Tax=Aquimarina brevivitae TaxID=323412 RepID=A0A4V2F5F3_9FLAO|nr:GNAT family N-acetyltransferase [Aquimarina brevivitae]RZS92619.1 putative acetyltransferase [Aquimarina brevivitae]
MSEFKVRPIQPEDDEKIAAVIRNVLIEMGVPKVGTAYEDVSLDCMYETYDKNRCIYYVVAKGEEIYGGGGIAPLIGEEETICELQKMYFLSEIRGKGLGKSVIEKCIAFAAEQNYQKCYLETMPYMEAARKLYRKLGFSSLPAPIGNTGHYSCQEWMIKEL